MAHRKVIRKVMRTVAHHVWIGLQEQGAMLAGVPIELDPADTRDRFAPSPMVREVSASTYARETVTEVTRNV